MEEIISLKDIWVYFDSVVVLQNINLTVREGEFLGIIGPNGGGKTTLLKVILGLIRPAQGEVKVFGKDPAKARGLIGYVPQYSFFDLSFPISVFDTVLMGRYQGILKRYSIEDKKAATDALKAVDMWELKDEPIGQLSGGQRQRVFLARAIARQPKLLLLDEPTTSIDPQIQESFYKMLLELKKKMTIVMVTHDISAVSVYVDKVACLNRELFYHGSKNKTLEELKRTYTCPIDLITHGIIHKFPQGHEKDGNSSV